MQFEPQPSLFNAVCRGLHIVQDPLAFSVYLTNDTRACTKKSVDLPSAECCVCLCVSVCPDDCEMVMYCENSGVVGLDYVNKLNVLACFTYESNGTVR